MAEAATGTPPVDHAVDLESIPGQVGTATLRAADGSLVRPCTGSLSEGDADVMYRILLEVGALLPSTSSNSRSKPEVAVDSSTGGASASATDGGAVGEDGDDNVERLRRVTVGFLSVRYSATVATDGFVYMVKSKAS